MALAASPADRGEREGAQDEDARPAPVHGRLRTRTLVLLRWLALFGQASAVLVAAYGLSMPVPVFPCLLLVALSALFNLALSLTPAMRRPALAWEAAAQLAFDILQLSTLLFLTGGVLNPFALLLIAPVTVAAATLPGQHAGFLAVLAVVATLVLSLFAAAMPVGPGERIFLPPSYRLGSALAVIVGILFTAAYAFRAASEARRMELALHVTETVLAREQRLGALGALAAAAAHELGTPLATISVIARELVRETPEGPLKEDADMLLEQAQRCRDILARLTATPETGDQVHERMSLLQLLREIIEPLAGKPQVRCEAVVTGPPGLPAPDVWRRPEILHAMTSILDNAFDFARAEILLTARFSAHAISLEVRDDGPGFSQEVLTRLGEPYVTSRPAAEGSRTGHVGMGLGFFIAKTLLERTGAKVSFRNGRRSRGAVVTASWVRSRLEAPQGVAEAALRA